MQYIKLTFFTCALLLSQSVSAYSTWKNYTTIEGVEVLEDGAFVLYLPMSSSASCKGGGREFYVAANKSNVTEAGLNNLLTVAMAAYKERTSVNLKYEIIDNSCYVSKIQMKKY